MAATLANPLLEEMVNDLKLREMPGCPWTYTDREPDTVVVGKGTGEAILLEARRVKVIVSIPREWLQLVEEPGGIDERGRAFVTVRVSAVNQSFRASVGPNHVRFAVKPTDYANPTTKIMIERLFAIARVCFLAKGLDTGRY